jgi:effector-binding domain-containing protein
MLTLPKIVDRAATHYAAVAAEVSMPFDEAMGPPMEEAEAYLSGVGDIGLAVFRYDVIDMPRLEMQFGFMTPASVPGNDRVKPGVLPAGQYVTVTYTGPYDDLESVTAVVIGWARQKAIEWDSIEGPTGERFASRFELYLNGPTDEPDPQKWVTEVWIKTKG